MKMKWSTGLEKCHAQLLNEAMVSGFYNLLKELVMEYNVPAENIYNYNLAWASVYVQWWIETRNVYTKWRTEIESW